METQKVFHKRPYLQPVRSITNTVKCHFVMAVATKPTVCCDVTLCSTVDTKCGFTVDTYITTHKTVTMQTINIHFNIISQTIHT